MKISIIGYSGAGKSTLAKFLGGRENAEVLHLDAVYWLPDWQACDRAEGAKKVEAFLDSHESWVIDGNYSSFCYDRRMEEADFIVFLNFNRFFCLFRAIRRYLTNRGKTREDLGEGCLEKIDWEFVQWILYESRTKQRKKRVRALQTKYPDKWIELKNQRELTVFVDSIQREGIGTLFGCGCKTANLFRKRS